MQEKYLFIDRDGTLIVEPADEQVDSLDKLALMPGVIKALQQLKSANFKLVMVTNQDGLGTTSFPEENFIKPQEMMLAVFSSQGIEFDEIYICPHFDMDNCECRKPKVGLLMDYLREQKLDRENSYVIGDRDSDIELAQNLGIAGLKLGSEPFNNWQAIIDFIINKPRTAIVERKTNETDIKATINLDATAPINLSTGIGFFDHMLEQLAKHGGFSLQLRASGDLHIDEHHTVEDTAITLGMAIKKALGDKLGINRYGFVLPMDETVAQVAIDFSGRPHCNLKIDLQREDIGGFATELIPHFFTSLSESIGAAIHINVAGVNEHHMVEAAFKGLGRAMRQAIKKEGTELPSTKGLL